MRIKAMQTRTRMETALRGISGALAMAVMLYLVLAAPGLLSDRDSIATCAAWEARR